MTSRQVVRILLIGVVAAFGVYFSLPFLKQQQQMIPSDGVSAPIASSIATTPEHELHVLFIGNSYTFYNNLPQMLVDIATSDTQNRTRFVVQSVTKGGIDLKYLWENGEAVKLLRSRHWDYVVLQEQSFWAMSSGSVHATTVSARQFDDEIKKTGGRTLLFTSWARQAGSQWYTNEQYSFLRNPAYMQQQFNRNTQNLAENLGAVAIPVGDYWAFALAKQPDLPLYSGDGSHPAPTGTYLSALVFYRYFAGHSLEHVAYVPPGVTPEHAAFLRSIVNW